MSVNEELMLYIVVHFDFWSPVKLSSFVHIVAYQKPNVVSHTYRRALQKSSYDETNACKN